MPGSLLLSTLWLPQRQLTPAGQRSRNYARGWLLLDLTASFPLECVLTAAAPRVNFYNFGLCIRRAPGPGRHAASCPRQGPPQSAC